MDKHVKWSDACHHHAANETKLVCVHLANQLSDSDYCRWFTGQGLQYTMVCKECCTSVKRGDTTIELRRICELCAQELEDEDYWDGIVGQPEIVVRSTTLSISRDRVFLQLPAALCALQPVNTRQESCWIGLTSDGDLYSINLSTASIVHLMHLPVSKLDLSQNISLVIAPDGQFIAIANMQGQHGLVINLSTHEVTMQLLRDDYHNEHTHFPIAFVEFNGRPLLIHSTKWNRLDLSDPRTGELLSERSVGPRVADKNSEHSLDYFHSGLSISPDQQWIVDNGWVWHPYGIVITWNLRNWIAENVWESEDGSSRKSLCARGYYWDGPLCWIDEQTLAVWGYGDDDEWLLPAVRIFDVVSGKELRWFAGPIGTLVFDDYLFSFSPQDGLAAWDVMTGERVLSETDFCPTHYHRGARQFLQLDAQDKSITIGVLKS